MEGGGLDGSGILVTGCKKKKRQIRQNLMLSLCFFTAGTESHLVYRLMDEDEYSPSGTCPPVE